MNSFRFRLGVQNVSPVAIAILSALAFWPVWRWYGLRLRDSGEEIWGLAALLGAVWVVWGSREVTRARSRIGRLPVLVTGMYAATYTWLPPMLRAILALTALGGLLPALGLTRRAAFQTVGLLFLSLPIIPSLQFYLGYPLRVVSGEAAARLINLTGYPVVRDGVLLSWRDHAVFIDAPCSGIKMLWAGLVLSLVLSAHRRYRPPATSLMAVYAVGAVVMGNSLRTTALFFLETGVVRGPAWAHEAIGVSVFTAVVAVMVWVDGRRPGDTAWHHRAMSHA